MMRMVLLQMSFAFLGKIGKLKAVHKLIAIFLICFGFMLHDNRKFQQKRVPNIY